MHVAICDDDLIFIKDLKELWYGNIEPTEYDAIACK